MRIAIDLPADLHAQVMATARDTNHTPSESVALLVRRGLDVRRAERLGRSDATGLPLVRLGRVITTQDVRAIEDD